MTLGLVTAIVQLVFLVVGEIIGIAERARANGETRKKAIDELEAAVAAAIARMKKDNIAASADAARAEDAADRARKDWPNGPSTPSK